MEIRGTNEYTHIILKYNHKIGKYEDITSDVIYIKDDLTSWYVVFKSKKGYNFKYKDIVVSESPQEIMVSNKNVYINNVLTYVFKIIYFNNVGYKIFISNNNSIFIEDIIIENTKIIINNLDKYRYKTNNKVFSYYKSLAHYASDINTDVDSIDKLVFNLYKKIDNINTDSALYSYTTQEYLKRDFNRKSLIFPFSTNASQIKAVKSVFENNVSIISGPPGTGKTQVILNLIANSIIQNKKIAVISNNNTAVENVYDKLKEMGYEFILASLGNSINVENFFKTDDFIQEKINNLDYNEEKNSADVEFLERLYRVKNKLQLLEESLYNIETEFMHFKCNNSDKRLFNYNIKVKNYESFLELKNILTLSKRISFLQRVLIKLKYKIKLKLINDMANFIYYLDYMYYETRINELQNDIKSYNRYLEQNSIKNLENELKISSINLLNKFLINKYKGKQYRVFSKDNYKEYFDEFVDRYPVTLSTTHSLLRNCEPGFMYDLVIIDEGSQSDILTSLLTMNITSNIVIIGDEKQLSQIDNQNIYDASEKLAKMYYIDSVYRYKENSILKSVLSLENKPSHVLLREHYRCDLRIIKFCNDKFYDGQLIICTKTADINPLEITYTVVGNHARKNPFGTGQYNVRECDEIINILNNIDSTSIGIITPFKAQADYILKNIRNDFPNVEVDTIHKYQGRQKDIIILSTVVNDLKDANEDFITNFVTNSQLLNVAISRAVKKIYLVVSNGVYNSNKNNIAQFIEYIKYYCNDSINEGKIVSIFDSLYKDSNKILKKQKFKKKFDSLAEEILMGKIAEILNDYPEYNVRLHVRLNDLISNYDNFTNKELKYIRHPWTHVDFVIFDKITYKPVLCIELDGTRYHDYSDKQTIHDNIKTKVLEQNNITLLRLKTNESNEIDKIRNLL